MRATWLWQTCEQASGDSAERLEWHMQTRHRPGWVARTDSPVRLEMTVRGSPWAPDLHQTVQPADWPDCCGILLWLPVQCCLQGIGLRPQLLLGTDALDSSGSFALMQTFGPSVSNTDAGSVRC